MGDTIGGNFKKEINTLNIKENEKDSWCWKSNGQGQYTVSDTYKILHHRGVTEYEGMIQVCSMGCGNWRHHLI